MQIISPFKDYYDYVAGPDPDRRIVYARHCQAYREVYQPIPGVADSQRPGGLSLIGPHSPDPTPLFGPLSDPEESAVYVVYFCGLAYPVEVTTDGFHYESYATWDYFPLNAGAEPVPSGVNASFGVPVVLAINGLYLVNCQLSAIDFAKRVSAEAAFMAIYDFLIPKEVTPDDNPSNLTRFEAKGFDRKVSFRKRK